MDKISIVVPCYNEENVLNDFYETLVKVTKEIENTSIELIFVDDGSKDKTLEIIKKFREKNKNIKYISFSRNFGKESAIYAGLKMATGDYISLIDADLQDPPELLKEMYKIVKEEKYDCVATKRKTRKGEPIIRTFFAKLFYKIFNRLSKVKLVDGARDFRLMSKQMVDEILKLSEYNRFSKGIFSWIGFKTKWLEYENIERKAGKSKWSFWGLFKYSIEAITGFSTIPLAISSVLGILLCIVSIISIIIVIINKILFDTSAYGWASLVCIMLFISGIQLFCIGILGQYVSKIYLESKKRPLYIIKEKEG